MHWNFYHPSPRKLLSLIRQSKMDHTDKETRHMLKDIFKSFSSWKTFLTKHERFRACNKNDEVLFNGYVDMDLI